MDTKKVDLSDMYLGFVTEGLCSECNKPTFSADGVCMACKVEIAEDDRKYFTEKMIDCE